MLVPPLYCNHLLYITCPLVLYHIIPWMTLAGFVSMRIVCVVLLVCSGSGLHPLLIP